MKIDALAYWLLEQMETRDWTQRELARRSGIGKSTINRLVNRQVMPTVQTLRAIAQAINLPVSELIAAAGIEQVTLDEFNLHVLELASLANALPESDQQYLVEIARYLLEEETSKTEDGEGQAP